MGWGVGGCVIGWVWVMDKTAERHARSLHPPPYLPAVCPQRPALPRPPAQAMMVAAATSAVASAGAATALAQRPPAGPAQRRTAPTAWQQMVPSPRAPPASATAPPTCEQRHCTAHANHACGGAAAATRAEPYGMHTITAARATGAGVGHQYMCVRHAPSPSAATLQHGQRVASTPSARAQHKPQHAGSMP